MSLWRIRRELRRWQNVAVHSGRDGVQLNCTDVDVDLDRFRESVARAAVSRDEERRQLLIEAEAAYTGDFLEGILDDWCEEERRALKTTYEGVLREIGTACLETADYGSAIEHLEKLVRLSPYDEDAHRELMRAYYMAGKRGAALSHFQRMKQNFAEELQSSPSAATIQLYEHIRASADWLLPSASKSHYADDVKSAPADSFAIVPLIGRGREADRICRALDHGLEGRGSSVLICGDIGVGKTKLIDAVTVEARLRGFDVFIGVCPDLEYPSPYQVLIQALWPRIRGRLVSGGASAKYLYQIGGGSPFPSASSLEEPDASRGQAEGSVINEYVADLLRSALVSPRATLLILEDIHRIDRASEGFLVNLLGRLPAARVVVVLSARRGERDSERIISTLLAAGAEVMELAPLAEDDVARLVEMLLGRVTPIRRFAGFVHRRTGGVPLFVVELTKFLVSEKYVRRTPEGAWVFDERSVTADNWRLPSQVMETIRRRILRLLPEAQRFLGVAAVIGSEVPYEVLEHLLGIPEDRFIETVEDLSRSRLLLESEGGLRFPHESIRMAALNTLSRTRLRKLHSKVAAILEVLAPGRTSDIGWHHAEAGNLVKAAQFFELSGDRARNFHANEDAVRYYSHAISSIEASCRESQQSLRHLASVLLKRCEVLDLVGERAQQAQDIDSVIRIAVRLGDPSLRGQGLYLLSQVQARLNLNADALKSASEAEYLFRIARDMRGRALAAQSAGLVYVNLRNEREAGRALRRSVELFRNLGDQAGEARSLVHLGTVMTIARDSRTSMQCLNRAERVLRGLGDKRSLAWAVMQKGVLCRYVGQVARSEELLMEGVRLMQEIGDKIGEARGRSQLSCTRVAMGKLRDGLRDAITASRLARESRDVRAMIVILNNAAYTTLRCLGNFARAQECARAAIRMVSRDGGAENKATYYDTMAAVLLDKGDSGGALRWGKQAYVLHARRKGHFGFVGDEIAYHLGLAYLRLGKVGSAEHYFNRAVNSWRRSGDLVGLIHGVSALGELGLARGRIDEALEAAREVQKLLRKVDGLEQIQQVYWTQYRIYSAAGARVAARRALRRACAEIGRQADTLKGRSRRRFLAIPVHVEILREAEKHGMGIGDFRVGEWSWRPAPDPALRIDQRRQAILSLIAEGDISRKAIAGRLGVSERTVESDVAALRREGLIGGHG
ncbi:MAG: BTAD domain-containing putative transcriptional regulator, partial [Armatimonadota bacterium]|nr:BTAD domain-containing putative transcriptional regulator [Armatimonadota bacterium]